jgi:ATP-dependent DNA helicase RecQ
MRETFRMFENGLSPAEIAQKRGLAESTIWSHLSDALAAGQPVDVRRLLTEKEESQIREVLITISGASLAPAKEKVGDKFSYGQIRLGAAAMGRLG